MFRRLYFWFVFRNGIGGRDVTFMPTWGWVRTGAVEDMEIAALTPAGEKIVAWVRSVRAGEVCPRPPEPDMIA